MFRNNRNNIPIKNSLPFRFSIESPVHQPLHHLKQPQDVSLSSPPPSWSAANSRLKMAAGNIKPTTCTSCHKRHTDVTSQPGLGWRAVPVLLLKAGGGKGASAREHVGKRGDATVKDRVINGGSASVEGHVESSGGATVRDRVVNRGGASVGHHVENSGGATVGDHVLSRTSYCLCPLHRGPIR